MLTTADQCHRYVLEGIKKANAGTLTPQEFTIRYNAAQLSLVRSAYEQVDRDQKHMDLLRILTPPQLLIANTGSQQPEGEVFLLPYVVTPPPGTSHGYMHMLSVGLQVASNVNGQQVLYTCSNSSGFSSAKVMARDARYVHDRNPFKRPKPERPYVYFTGNQFTARCGQGYYASRALIEYLRYPVEIDATSSPTVDPELPAAVNQSVCDLVIRQYLEAVQSSRVSTVAQNHPLHT